MIYFIAEICWTTTIWIVKYSIICLYWRLSSTNHRSIQISIWVLTLSVTCWGIGVVSSARLYHRSNYQFLFAVNKLLLTILNCVPVSAAWNLMAPGYCNFDNLELFTGSSVPHIIIDLTLLGFPMPIIWKLHMRRSQKFMLTAIFAVGSLYVTPFFAPTL